MSRNGDKALIEIRDSNKTLDIDLNADLSGPYILFRSRENISSQSIWWHNIINGGEII